MTPDQTAQVLAAAAGRDNRTIGRADVLAWHQDIGDLPYEDCLSAVSVHYRQTTDRMMPAHVRRIVEPIVAARNEQRARQAAIEAEQRRAIDAPPVGAVGRSATVTDLVSRLRDALPSTDATVLRRPEVVAWERERKAAQRRAAAGRDYHGANPHFTGPPPPGGYPVPDEDDQAGAS